MFGFGFCCCGTSCTTPVHQCFHVNGCSANVAGATVSITDGTHPYSGTTDGSGNVCFDFTDSGTYTGTVIKTGYATHSVSVTIVCGTTPASITVNLSLAANYSCTHAPCCTSESGPPYLLTGTPPYPSTLILNDGLGNVTLTNTSPGSNGPWTGSATRTAAHAHSCLTGLDVTGVSVTVYFEVTCGGNLEAGGPNFGVQLTYYSCRNLTGGGGCDTAIAADSADSTCPQYIIHGLTGTWDCDSASVSLGATFSVVALDGEHWEAIYSPSTGFGSTYTLSISVVS